MGRSESVAFVIIGIAQVLCGGWMTVAGLGILDGLSRSRGTLTIVGAIFLVMGIGLLVVACRSLEQDESERSPKLWKTLGWSSRTVESSAWQDVSSGLRDILLIGGFVGAIQIAAWRSPAAVLVLVPFDLIVLGAAAITVYSFIAALRWGRNFLDLPTTPFFLGQPLHATFRTTGDITSLSQVVVRLECCEIFIAGKRKNPRVETRILWSAENTVTSPGSSFDVRFDLPPREDLETRPDMSRYWRITVSGTAPGPDFRANFPIPVFWRDGRAA